MTDAEQVGGCAEPREATALESPAVEGGEHPLKGVVGRNAFGQLQEASKPRCAFLGELCDVRPIIAVADHGANGHHHDVDQQMPCSADDSRIRQVTEMLLERPHVSSSNHAFLRKAGEYPEES